MMDEIHKRNRIGLTEAGQIYFSGSLLGTGLMMLAWGLVTNKISWFTWVFFLIIMLVSYIISHALKKVEP